MMRDQVPISKRPNPVAVIAGVRAESAAATTRSPPTSLAPPTRHRVRPT